MDAATVGQRIAALLAGDNLLQTRLAEVEAKFDAWLVAMSAGQCLLREALGRARASEPKGIAEPRPVAPPAAPGTAPTSVLTPSEPTGLGDDAVTDDDERLLATLDSDTANAIRVKRRLCGERRSVRELLEEIQAARAGKAPARKRWWRRDDE